MVARERNEEVAEGNASDFPVEYYLSRKNVKILDFLIYNHLVIIFKTNTAV